MDLAWSSVARVTRFATWAPCEVTPERAASSEATTADGSEDALMFMNLPSAGTARG
jgi:hypothetical protein